MYVIQFIQIWEKYITELLTYFSFIYKHIHVCDFFHFKQNKVANQELIEICFIKFQILKYDMFFKFLSN